MATANTASRQKYSNEEDRFWDAYLEQAKDEDEHRVERWRGDTDGILVFMGLFASTVASFVIASYPSFSQPSGSNDENTILLRQLVTLMLVNESRHQDDFASRSADPFTPSTTSVCINTLWFLSLIVSIICALLAVMVQQWTRRYAQNVQRSGRELSPSVRGQLHSLLSTGAKRFKMDDAIDFITALVHVAVGLFFVGLIVQLSALNAVLASVTGAVMSLGAIFYAFLTVSPLTHPDSPYQTPLTDFLRSLHCWVLPIVNSLVMTLTPTPKHTTEHTESWRWNSPKDGRLLRLERMRISSASDIWLRAIVSMCERATNAAGILHFLVVVLPVVEFPDSKGVDGGNPFSPRPDGTSVHLTPEHVKALCSFLAQKTNAIPKAVWLLDYIISGTSQVSQTDHNRYLATTCLFLRNVIPRAQSEISPDEKDSPASSSLPPATHAQVHALDDYRVHIDKLLGSMIEHPRNGAHNQAPTFCFSPYFLAYTIQTSTPPFSFHSWYSSSSPLNHVRTRNCAIEAFLLDPSDTINAGCTLSFKDLKKPLEFKSYHTPRKDDCITCRLFHLLSFVLTIGVEGWPALMDTVAWQPFLILLHRDCQRINPPYSSDHNSHPPTVLMKDLMLREFDLQQDSGPHAPDVFDPSQSLYPYKIRVHHLQLFRLHPELVAIVRDLISWSGLG